MLKSELARRAGVSVNTLMAWCRPFKSELEHLGMKACSKKLPPHVVQFLAEKFCIEL